MKIHKMHPLLLPVLLVFLVTGCKQKETHGMELEGMFRYMADAAVFRDCRSNTLYPVSMEGEYIELERAYLNSGIAPETEVMIRLEGRLLERPAMEGNNNEVKLIVDKLHKILIGKTCAPTVHSQLTGTYWKLVELDGTLVRTPEGMTQAHMILESDQARVGTAGVRALFSPGHNCIPTLV